MGTEKTEVTGLAGSLPAGAADAERFLAMGKRKRKVEEVRVKDEDGTEEVFHVKTISGDARDELEEALRVQKGKKQSVSFKQFRARVVCAAMCTVEGKSLFSERDVPQVGDLPNVALEAIFDAAMKLNGLKADAVEEAEGN